MISLQSKGFRRRWRSKSTTISTAMADIDRETLIPARPVAGERARAPKAIGGRHAVSLPNLLTYGRIVAIPAIVLALMLRSDGGRWAALTIFVVASVTDFFDGYLAPAWH